MPITRLTPADVKTLLQEKAPPSAADDPLTVTNSIVLHLTERTHILERAVVHQSEIIKQLLGALPALRGKGVSGDGELPSNAEVTVDEEGEAVVVNNARVVAGAIMPAGPGGAVQGGATPAAGGAPARAADATPFPAGVPASAPPGTGQKVTVVASASASEAPAAGKKSE